VKRVVRPYTWCGDYDRMTIINEVYQVAQVEHRLIKETTVAT